MRIGVPKEIKDNEGRIALTPAGASALAGRGHEVVVERGAGVGAGFADADYLTAGARLAQAADCWASELVVKVKEPLASEHRHFHGQIVFTYFHLAGVGPALAQALLATRTTAVAYETVEDEHGRLPLLAPMSAIAGSMAALVGSYYLARPHGGRGVLLGTILGTRHGKVTIAGDGTVAQNAARVAAAMGTRVVVLGRDRARAVEIARIDPAIEYEHSDDNALERHLRDTDLFIGATLVKGARAAHVVSEEMVRAMLPGSVIVDVSIDQGGCVATSRPTSHADPVFVAHGVTHYCVTNMPGAFPRTATLALAAKTLPYVESIADGGVAALRADPGFAKGINTYSGFVTCRPVAEALGMLSLYRDLAALQD